MTTDNPITNSTSERATPMSETTFNYSNTETVAVSDLQVGEVVFDPQHPDRPYRITGLTVLKAFNPFARTQVRGTGNYPARWIQISATSVYAKWGVSAGTFGTFDPAATLERAVLNS